MRYFRSSRSFLAGTVLGILLGSVGVGTASIGYKAWQKLSQDYKIGYVNGFLDLARLARNLDPGGYLDTRYPDVTKAKPIEWAYTVDQLYKDPENQGYTLNSILQAAAHQLEKKYGPALSPHERTRMRMEKQLNAARRNQEAKAATTPSGQKKTTVQAPPKQVETASVDPKKVSEPEKKKQKKWCRCDGTDFREARRKRRAAAAEAEAKAKEKAASASSPE